MCTLFFQNHQEYLKNCLQEEDYQLQLAEEQKKHPRLLQVYQQPVHATGVTQDGAGVEQEAVEEVVVEQVVVTILGAGGGVGLELTTSQASSADEVVVSQGGAGLEQEGGGSLHDEVGFVRVVETITR